MLSKEEFLATVKNTPLVSIDLVVRAQNGKVLMGKRINRPAAGYWFVPGGRIYKGETLEDAFKRISLTELGIELEISAGVLLGAFTHIYADNFAGAAGIGTHYVVLAYQLHLEAADLGLPDQQHSAYRWFAADDDLSEAHFNSLAYFPYLQ
ncbi:MULTISPECIES: GDP-mannose mannosyl hydrolase [Methylomonas]|uniref:GDP-mannose mannosyl hydrolase n=1 Tax=Methylomonas TaxID=416 RepID=UPI001231B42A|nr:GDP-mannose mannosyl hydrolase [Methylomonas rhizoryzae]